MHSLLAHAYHLFLHGLAFALKPQWRAPATAIFVAWLLRAHARLAAPLALLAGWVAVQYPQISLLPAHPVDRLPGLAILLFGFSFLPGPGGMGRVALPALAAAASWWIAGAPLTGTGLANALPVFPGVWAALAITRRMAARNTGAAGVFAALALSLAIFLAGGAAHWARAALVPAFAGAVLLGLPAAALSLAFATTLLACLAVFASNRGQFLPVDLAILAPFLVWLLMPHSIRGWATKRPGARESARTVQE